MCVCAARTQAYVCRMCTRPCGGAAPDRPRGQRERGEGTKQTSFSGSARPRKGPRPRREAAGPGGNTSRPRGRPERSTGTFGPPRPQPFASAPPRLPRSGSTRSPRSFHLCFPYLLFFLPLPPTPPPPHSPHSTPFPPSPVGSQRHVRNERSSSARAALCLSPGKGGGGGGEG